MKRWISPRRWFDPAAPLLDRVVVHVARVVLLSTLWGLFEWDVSRGVIFGVFVGIGIAISDEYERKHPRAGPNRMWER